MDNQRLDPDELLSQIQDEEQARKRGKLKIYLGAAPGVGKTYTMLQDAHKKHDQGVDVIIGVVESHGRIGIEELIQGLEILPRLNINYKGKELHEFDLLAALKRKPNIILVDEMAHSNLGDTRHEKRWQDIKELLDRGIDVYTTLNVQHIESLKDDVSAIINAPINETVPDSMLELADTIELVDLPPEELLNRLREGKVYYSHQAEVARENFFKTGNLIALREMALRVTAARVGAQVLLYRKGHGIKEVWFSNEKILVCVGPGAESLKLIRAARRLATSLQAKWIAVYIDSPRFQLSKIKRNNAISNLRVAESLGAHVKILSGFDIVNTAIEYAREQNCTLIMVWKFIRPRWVDFVRKRIADELVRNSNEINVYIMTGSLNDVYDDLQDSQLETQELSKAYLSSVAVVIVATFINYFLINFVTPKALIFVYLVAVSIVSLSGLIGPSLLATVLSVCGFIWLFFPGKLTFSSTDIEYVLTILMMLILIQAISYLIVLTRRQTLMAKSAEKQATDLHTLSRKLASTRGVDNLLKIAVEYVAEIFSSDVVALLPEKGVLAVRVGFGEAISLDEKEISVAQWVYELGQKAGLGTDTLSMSNALYVPLNASVGTLGVLRISPKRQDQLFSPEQMNFLDTCASQVALAVEVDRLQQQSMDASLSDKIESAKEIVMRSATQDLRAPLAAIMLKASSQIQMADKLSKNDIKELGLSIYKHTERLSGLINNLLQMNSFENGVIDINFKIDSLKVLLNQVVQKALEKFGRRQIYLKIPTNLPQIYFSFKLLGDALFNIIENAFKYGPANMPIAIVVKTSEDQVIISITDHGPGIAQENLSKIFDKFYRDAQGLDFNCGLGLGLAISKIIVEAHHGKIWAENSAAGGAELKISLPLTRSG